MQPKKMTRLAMATGSALLAGRAAVAADKPQADPQAVDKAFETLKTYDWGADRNLLNPIDVAIIATEGDADGRKQIEVRLVELLKADTTRSAKDFICRKLRTIGTTASVPALAALLTDADNSHMARYALERMPCPEAAAALRDALGKVDGKLKAGMIGSLGTRRDQQSVGALAGLLADSDARVACAAANSLGVIGSPAAAKALGGFIKKAPEGVKTTVVDAYLVCAEHLLADGNKGEALAIYKSLNTDDQPKHVRMAATRGLLAVAGKKD